MSHEAVLKKMEAKRIRSVRKRELELLGHITRKDGLEILIHTEHIVSKRKTEHNLRIEFVYMIGRTRIQGYSKKTDFAKG